MTVKGPDFRIHPNTGEFIDGDLGDAGSLSGLNMDGPVNGGTTIGDGEYSSATSLPMFPPSLETSS